MYGLSVSGSFLLRVGVIIVYPQIEVLKMASRQQELRNRVLDKWLENPNRSQKNYREFGRCDAANGVECDQQVSTNQNGSKEANQAVEKGNTQQTK